MMKSNENNGAVTKSFAKKMESISPFELKNKLIEMADESIKKIAHTMLNAGRGNPNWIATTPREAFFLLGKFGLEECRRVMYLPEGIAGIPQKDGIAARFETFLKTNHSQPGGRAVERDVSIHVAGTCRRPGYPCPRMGGRSGRRSVSGAGPHSAIYRNDCARLSGTGDVRPSSAERQIRFVCHRRRNSSHVLRFRLSARKLPAQ